MMGDTRKPGDPKNVKDRESRRPNPHDSTHDPEFEMPDPEKIERDIEQAERIYRENEKKKRKPAA